MILKSMSGFGPYFLIAATTEEIPKRSLFHHTTPILSHSISHLNRIKFHMDSRSVLPPKFRLKPLRIPQAITKTVPRKPNANLAQDCNVFKGEKDYECVLDNRAIHESRHANDAHGISLSTALPDLASETETSQMQMMKEEYASSSSSKSHLYQSSKRLKRALETPSCGLPSPASTASYISNYTSPSISSFTKRLRLTYKAPDEDDYINSYSNVISSQNTSSFGLSTAHLVQSPYRQYASVGNQRPKNIDNPKEKDMSTDTKYRALQMIQWALSCNTQLRHEYVPTVILGWGGCGAVFEAERKVDGEKVAIKIMYKSSKRSGVPTEINILSSLNHQNIVSYHGFFEDRKATYLVMERFGKIWKTPSELGEEEVCTISDPQSLYRHFQNPAKILSGTSSSLFEYIDHSKSGKVPSRSLRPLFKQICLALYYLHQKNIIHGDLKEENILIGNIKGRLVAKLCDFGHSCKVDVSNPRMRLYGTRVLTPPELLNHLHADEKGLPCMEPLQTGFEQDIWALGIVFWTMLHGALPAENESYIRGDFDLDEFTYYPSSFSAIKDADCLDLLQNMLTIDPRTRLCAFDVVNHPYFH